MPQADDAVERNRMSPESNFERAAAFPLGGPTNASLGEVRGLSRNASAFPVGSDMPLDSDFPVSGPSASVTENSISGVWSALNLGVQQFDSVFRRAVDWGTAALRYGADASPAGRYVLTSSVAPGGARGGHAP
ncbi:hypothetical protein, partial [Paraburkholderia aspalathi]|uniref:hypothetical protein n=1 Tax=Paraburkholderia aspalathi TaxID=1324617 RepID=UPI0038BAA307